ncbi:MAG TPA: CoA-binding protein [Rectinemataceae bacterium]|nr:CoA-binding protein [Rectinemataceae bacterium]
MRRALEELFSARGCAVVGASQQPKKAGHQIVANMLAAGYAHGLYPITPSGGEILGCPSYPSVSSIPAEVQLVILSAPSRATASIVEDLKRRMEERGDLIGVVCAAAGFAEVGTPEGKANQELLASFCRDRNLRLVGPNCVGVIDTASRVDTTFIAGIVHAPGGISLASQSGALGAWLLMDWSSTPAGRVGFRRFVTVGNMADVDIIEGIENLGADPGTKVLGLYIEGSPKARDLAFAIGLAASRKPVLALKVGRSSEGARAAKSHTGSMAGADAVYDGVFRQLGILRVRSPRELSDGLRAFDSLPLPRGGRTFILTQAGGPGIICVDECSEAGNIVPAMVSGATKAAIRAVVPEIASVCEPEGHADITAAADADNHVRALEAVLRDDGVDAVILITVATLVLDLEGMARKMVQTLAALRLEGIDKPVFPVILSGEWVMPCRRVLEEGGLPTWDGPERAVRALSLMIERVERSKRSKE